MAMSNAERQRKYRLNRNRDAEKRSKFLQQSKERYIKDRLSGKNKSVKSMTNREKRHARKQWRNQKQKDRERTKSVLNTLKNAPTPPSTPEHVPEFQESRQKKYHTKKENRNKAKCYRENNKLKVEIENLNKKIRMYQKRLERSVNKDKTDSPRTKTRKLLRNLSGSQTKRCIFMYNCVTEQLRNKYAEKKRKDKANFAKILTGHVLKKYRLQTETQNILGIQTKMTKGTKTGYYSLTKRVCEKVKAFYTRNDNSRLVSGKRQTKTVKKIRKQRRVLLQSLKTLHTKFLCEGKIKLSYTQFCKLRPFYVVFPRKSDRDTCVCKVCDNTQLMAEALKKVNAITNDDIGILVSMMVCNTKNKTCMYRDCERCSNKSVEVNKETMDKDVTWLEWKTNNEKRCIKQGGKDVEKVVAITVKEKMNGTVDTLLDKFYIQIDRYMKHMYRFTAQYYYYKNRTETLLDNECIVNIDFSENYICKHAHEIQALHFGASKKQLTLHTGVIHIKDKAPKTFCSVSNSLQHGPPAVWCHLKQMLSDIRSEHPDITSIEIFSDGPATQYKQKGNFYLTSIKPSELGFHDVKWSFFESGHGKGIPDAVGGSVKNFADKQVKYGHNITSATDFFNVLSGATKTQMYFVPETEITNEQELLKLVPLKAVQGTLHIHQIYILNPAEIAYRDLSCECKFENEHTEHLYKKACVHDNSYSQEKADLTQPQGNREEVSRSNSSNAKKPSRKRKQTKKLETESKRKPQENSDDASYSNSSKAKKPNRKRKQTKKVETDSKRKRKDNAIDYSKLLKNLNECKEFDELKGLCENLELPELSINPIAVSLNSNKLEVDFESMSDVPEDISDRRELYPCEVLTDGNCLPSCGSVYAYGKITESDELRVRIIHELTMNDKCYLNNEYLAKGVKENKKGSNLTLKFCQFSEYYIPGVQLNSDLVRNIYRQEVLSITENNSFMGIWQLYALASVLQVALYSVYPMKGNMNVRKDLHRLILPRHNQSVDNTPVYILWTNTRDDVTTEHWVPNHFVPLLPFETGVNKTVRKPPKQSIREENGKADNTGEQLRDAKARCNHGEDEVNKTCDNIGETKKSVYASGRVNNKTDKSNISSGEKKAKAQVNLETESNVDINNNIESGNEDLTEKFNLSEISQCIGKYVLFRFNNTAYPGCILDVEGTDIQISCMHKLGKKSENCFFWPQKIKDIFWYDYQDIICTIPEPVALGKSGHFRVDEHAWKSVLNTKV